MTGHAQSLKDAPGAGTGANGTRRAPPIGLAVGLGAAPEMIALDAAGKTLALGNADDIDNISGFKQADIYLLARLYLLVIIQA